MEDLKLTFDEDYNLRVFDPVKFATSEQLKQKSEDFSGSKCR